MSILNSITDITNIFYINLESRKDRKLHIESQLKTIGLSNFERFDAIRSTEGRIGCSMSHLKCLQLAKARNYNHVLICEDDTTFLNPQLFTTQLNSFFQNKNLQQWDVVLFSGNVIPPYIPVDNTCIKVKRCMTTTCYLVNNHYFDTLIQNITTGIHHLTREPNKYNYYSIDVYWTSLQWRGDNWYLIIPPTVIQKEDYSDIEKKNTNYANLMLDINKEYFQKSNSTPNLNLFPKFSYKK